jgi:hypothetical protein
MQEAATMLLEEKGYISLVDILLRMGMLTREDHEGPGGAAECAALRRA